LTNRNDPNRLDIGGAGPGRRLQAGDRIKSHPHDLLLACVLLEPSGDRYRSHGRMRRRARPAPSGWEHGMAVTITVEEAAPDLTRLRFLFVNLYLWGTHRGF
jgi:hypothetical protein